MTVSPQLREQIIAALPHLRAFALSLVGDLERADDLVQDGVLRAMSHIHQFQPGTSMQGWLFTILRNSFYSQLRRRKREIEDPEGRLASLLSVAPEQGQRLVLSRLQLALQRLPLEQREALLLVAAEGFSYEEAAAICKTKVGTIKSRVNRARTRLFELMGADVVEEGRTDRLLKAALQENARPE